MIIIHVEDLHASRRFLLQVTCDVYPTLHGRSRPSILYNLYYSIYEIEAVLKQTQYNPAMQSILIPPVLPQGGDPGGKVITRKTEARGYHIVR